jgi:hypothetical protein
MIKQDFIGLNGFIWWVGVVETRDDPLKLGRCRVRIFGWHADNLSDLPTEQLPFAQVLLPTTGTRTSSTIREGDWVSGYFLDGENAQEPVVVGIFPGIVSELSTREDDQRVFLTRRITTKQTPPRPPGEGGTPYVSLDNTVGEPTVPRQARGIITGTAIAYSNGTRDHICDISDEIKLQIRLARIQFGQFIESIRAGIRALIAALGLEPSGEISKLVSIAKWVLNELKKIQAIIAELADYVEVARIIVLKIAALAQYIASLPERIAAFLRDCLKSALTSIISEIGSASISAGVSADLGELTSTISEIGGTVSSITGDVAEIVTAPVTIVQAFTQPASAEALAEAEGTFLDFVKTNTQDAKENSNVFANNFA